MHNQFCFSAASTTCRQMCSISSPVPLHENSRDRIIRKTCILFLKSSGISIFLPYRESTSLILGDTDVLNLNLMQQWRISLSLIIPLESTQMSHTVLINFQVDINFLHALFIPATDLCRSLIQSYMPGEPLRALLDVDFHLGFVWYF